MPTSARKTVTDGTMWASSPAPILQITLFASANKEGHTNTDKETAEQTCSAVSLIILFRLRFFFPGLGFVSAFQFHPSADVFYQLYNAVIDHPHRNKDAKHHHKAH